jgi:AraC-like DNA-binding protein
MVYVSAKWAMTVMTYSPAILDPRALGAFPWFQSGDVEDTCLRMSQLLKPHRLRVEGPGGPIQSRMNLARFAGISLTTIAFGRSMHVDSEGGSDYHVIILCPRGHADACVDGEPATINHEHGLFSQASWNYSATFSSDCEQFLIRIDSASIAANGGGAKVRFQRKLDLAYPALRPWIDLLRTLIDSEPLICSLQRHSLAAVNMERLLVRLLVEGQPLDDAGDRIYAIAPRCVRKAEAYIDEHAGEAIRLGDIAAAARVPPRTLQDGFRRFRTRTPMQYLNDRRLEIARRRLLMAADDERVIDVAMECGFLHLGRFAEAYRARFSESPSVTLRRAHR